MPIFIPLLAKFDVDPLFFGLLVALNLQTAFLSPPVAMAAFYLKGVSPPHVTLNQIFAGMMPFMGIQVLALALLYILAADRPVAADRAVQVGRVCVGPPGPAWLLARATVSLSRAEAACRRRTARCRNEHPYARCLRRVRRIHSRPCRSIQPPSNPISSCAGVPALRGTCVDSIAMPTGWSTSAGSASSGERLLTGVERMLDVAGDVAVMPRMAAVGRAVSAAAIRPRSVKA